MDTTFSDLVYVLVGYLNNIAPILVGITLLVFVWGLAMSVMKSGDEEAVRKGRQLATWGAIGLFVIVAVWGLVYLLVNSVFGPSDIDSDSDILDPVLIDIDFGK